MQNLSRLRLKPSILFLIALLTISFSQAQKVSKLDFSKDTISRADVEGANLTYVNNIKGGGQANATKQINLPVDKLKEILDACAANNVTNVAVIIISLRQADLAHYRRLNPESAASDAQLKGSQMLVFKVPRSAFTGAMGSKINVSKSNPLMLSLLSAGLLLLDSPYTGLPGGSGDTYFIFGSICPPPASCD